MTIDVDWFEPKNATRTVCRSDYTTKKLIGITFLVMCKNVTKHICLFIFTAVLLSFFDLYVEYVMILIVSLPAPARAARKTAYP